MDRLEERQALDQVLDAARGGLSAALVVRGEPGVGKTSLLGYAADSAAGFRCWRAFRRSVSAVFPNPTPSGCGGHRWAGRSIPT